MEFIRNCDLCGVVYTARGNRGRFCDPCKKIRRVEATRSYIAQIKKQRSEAAARPKPLTLGQVSALARKHGMTYGQYVAKYGEKR